MITNQRQLDQLALDWWANEMLAGKDYTLEHHSNYSTLYQKSESVGSVRIFDDVLDYLRFFRDINQNMG